MTTTPGHIQVPPDSSGKKADTSELVRGSDGVTVQRQNIVISDASDEIGRARVTGEDGRGALKVESENIAVLESIDQSLKEILGMLKLLTSS